MELAVHVLPGDDAVAIIRIEAFLYPVQLMEGGNNGGLPAVVPSRQSLGQCFLLQELSKICQIPEVAQRNRRHHESPALQGQNQIVGYQTRQCLPQGLAPMS